jgi:prolyl oligopeptidase PreP (S9A serine peptidase family)
MLRNSVPNAKENLFGLYQTENGLYTVTIDPNSASFSMHSMLEGFVMSDSLKLTLKNPLQKIRIVNNVAAVDVSKQRIFYLANSDYKFENPDSVANLLLVFDRNDPSKFQFAPLNNKGIPLSNLLHVPS